MNQIINKAQISEIKAAAKLRDKLRKQLEQLSQRALALKFDVTEQTIRKYEKQ